MSDPVTNLDLEDVLSSIRRLVSDTVPPAERPVAAEGERFVLTPALRVVPPEAPAAPPDTVAEPDSVARMAARIEAAVAAEGADFEPDGTEEPAPLTWADSPAEAPVFRRREAPPVQTSEPDVAFHHRRPGPAPTDAAEAPVLSEDMATDRDDDLSEAARELLVDEETLRAIVADVVRQELQGALGERITRNVRKLVRREIYRVLAEQDLA